VSVRLQWKSAASGEEGVFVLRDRVLVLQVFEDGNLDRADAETGEDGPPALRVSEPDGEGNVLVEALGGLELEAGGRQFGKVKLAAGGKVAYAVAGAGGELALDARSRSDDPLIGRDLGGYQVLARLGNGAMGIVYRALQRNLDRTVALKVLNPKAAETPLAVASFKREAVAAGRLSHPNLVQVYDVCHEQGLHFFSMEMVAGGDLEDRLRESGPLPWQEALGYIADAALALGFAEEHHLVHRDVKPENLMLTADGRAKLADLGMAATRGMVEKESAGGTPHFLAPECVGGKADHRADLYSLGCSLYRLLTGRTPFQGATVKDILRAHRDDDIPSARESAPDVPAPVDDLVAWMMAKDPTDRPQHASEVVEACEDLLHGGRSRGMLYALAGVAVAAIGIAVFFATRPAPEKEAEQVIVEVGAEEAEAERAKRLVLEQQLAFANAMRVSEGPLRVAALEDFLGLYPDGEQAEDARQEIARIEALPEDQGPPDDGGGNSEQNAAQTAALLALEQSVQADLDAGAYGAAHARLADAGLPAVLLVPILGSLQDASEAAFSEWERAHAAALDGEDFAAAADIRDAFRASFSAAAVPETWTARVDALAASAAKAEGDAVEREFRAAREAVLTALQDEALPAVLRLDLDSARAAVEGAADNCPHAGLAAALRDLVPLFGLAAEGADSVLSAIDGSGTASFEEPLEGRRAFVLSSEPEGVETLVQQRGERVEFLVRWSDLQSPAAFGAFVHGLAPEDADADALAALCTLYGAAAVADEIRGWQGVPDAATAGALAEHATGWLALEPRGAASAAPDAMLVERTQLARIAALAAALAEGEDYLALQRAREATRRFGLLAAWTSDGGSRWQFRP